MNSDELRQYLDNLSDREFIAVFDVINSGFSVSDTHRIVTDELMKRVHIWFGVYRDE